MQKKKKGLKIRLNQTTNDPLQNRMPPLIQISNNYQNLQVRKPAIRKLVQKVIQEESLFEREIHIIFVDDKYLSTLHKEYLDDPTPTDVMSFDLSDDDLIEGEIYISVDSAKRHASEFGVSLNSEIARLIIHGLLHLKGLDDSTASERKKMRAREDLYLTKYSETILL